MVSSILTRRSMRKVRAEWSATGLENQRSVRMGVRFLYLPPFYFVAFGFELVYSELVVMHCFQFGTERAKGTVNIDARPQT